MDEAGTASRSKLSSKVFSAFSCFGGNQSAKRFQTNSAHEPNDTDDCACKSGRQALLPTPAIVAEGGVGGRAEPLECSSYSSAGQVSIGSTVAAPSYSCEVVISMQGDEDRADSQSERHVEHNREKCSDSNQDLPYKHAPGAAHGKAPTRPLLLPATRARHVPGGPICPRMMLLLLPDHLKQAAGKAVPAGSTPWPNNHPRARPAALSAMPMDVLPMLLDHSILTPADQVADRPDIDSGNFLGAMSIEVQGTPLDTGKVSQRHDVTFSEGFEDPCQPAYRAPNVSTSVNTSVNTDRELGDKACSGRDDSAALHTHHISLGHTPNQHVSEDMLRGVASWDRAAVMARSLDWPSTAAPSGGEMMSQAASRAGRHSAGSNIYQLRQHFPKAQAMSGLERWAQLLQLLTAGRTLEQAMEDNRRCLARYSKASVRRPVKP